MFVGCGQHIKIYITAVVSTRRRIGGFDKESHKAYEGITTVGIGPQHCHAAVWSGYKFVETFRMTEQKSLQGDHEKLFRVTITRTFRAPKKSPGWQGRPTRFAHEHHLGYVCERFALRHQAPICIGTQARHRGRVRTKLGPDKSSQRGISLNNRSDSEFACIISERRG